MKDLVHCILKGGGLFGFVSSHATKTFAVFTFTSLVFKNRWYTMTMLLWTLLISFSRIYLGVHFPLDILGGILLGFIVAFLVYKAYVICRKHIYTGIAYQSGINGIPGKDSLVITGVFGFTIILLFTVIYALVQARFL